MNGRHRGALCNSPDLLMSRNVLWNFFETRFHSIALKLKAVRLMWSLHAWLLCSSGVNAFFFGKGCMEPRLVSNQLSVHLQPVLPTLPGCWDYRCQSLGAVAFLNIMLKPLCSDPSFLPGLPAITSVFIIIFYH